MKHKKTWLRAATALSLSVLFTTGVQEVSANNQAEVYTVERGDSLSKIANKLGIPLNQLIQSNNITNKDIIHIGQKLTVGNHTANLSKVEEVFKKDGVLPVDKSLYGITSRFGYRTHPLTGGNTSHHNGLDIATWDINKKDIYSILPGKVTFAGDSTGGFGYYVQIQHTGGIETLYAHMAEMPLVKVGEQVVAGQKIGLVGTTGMSTGPHLHLEVVENGKKVDPEPLMELVMNNKRNENAEKPIKPSASTGQPIETNAHIVKRGDTVSKIASQYGVTIRDMIKWNNMKDANLIHVGQKLVVSEERVVNSPSKTIEEQKKEVKKEIPKVEESKEKTEEIKQSGYRVKSGDSLWSIANRHKLTVKELKDKNKLKSDIIHVGQELVISGATEHSDNKNEQKEASSSYKIQRGDTLWKIANNHGMTVKELKDLNGLSSDLIFVGNLLQVK